jgi:predicted amidophosphoribosyltransferase
MPDEPLSFEEHLRRREDNASTVRCARCGKWIVATATKCPECGVNFQGEAQDFAHPSERDANPRTVPAWVLVIAVLLLLAMLAAVLGLA